MGKNYNVMKKSVWSRMADNHAKEVELCVRYREALLRVGDTRGAKDFDRLVREHSAAYLRYSANAEIGERCNLYVAI